ncbi:MAG: glycosyltransferase family 39 protein [Actinobacteria bacterium]|nr:glycosyltransferase family 39 protein [Actinomycetota bacterium]
MATLERKVAPLLRVAPTGWAATTTLLGALVVLSLFVRTRAIDATFWIDEGLSVGIASFPLLEIPEVLRQDGSPPLYYLLLHLWMDAFGSSEEATHALSIAFALLVVPVAFWAGRTLFGPRTGWTAAALAAVNPFLTIYAQETRMYSLVILLSMLATGAFLHGFVHGRRRYVALFAATLAVMLYTHNWALFFAVGALAALAVCLREIEDRRRLLTDATLAFGGAFLVYLPWVPTLLFQALHTGAPWSNPPSPLELIGGLSVVLAGQGSLVAIVLASGVGLSTVLRERATPERTAVLAAIALAAATLLSGWLFSQIAPAWANRYLGVLLGPLILLAAAALPRAGKLGLVALTMVFLFWVAYRAPEDKSNARELAQRFAPLLERGDLVVSTQPEQVPVLAYYLPDGLRYATPLGPVADPRVMDWRDAMTRLEQSSVATHLDPLLDDVEPGSHVMLVQPQIRDDDAWKADWTSLVRVRSGEWGAAFFEREGLTSVDYYAPPIGDDLPRALKVHLFEKTKPG